MRWMISFKEQSLDISVALGHAGLLLAMSASRARKSIGCASFSPTLASNLKLKNSVTGHLLRAVSFFLHLDCEKMEIHRGHRIDR